MDVIGHVQWDGALGADLICSDGQLPSFGVAEFETCLFAYKTITPQHYVKTLPHQNGYLRTKTDLTTGISKHINFVHKFLTTALDSVVKSIRMIEQNFIIVTNATWNHLCHKKGFYICSPSIRLSVCRPSDYPPRFHRFSLCKSPDHEPSSKRPRSTAENNPLFHASSGDSFCDIPGMFFAVWNRPRFILSSHRKGLSLSRLTDENGNLVYLVSSGDQFICTTLKLHTREFRFCKDHQSLCSKPLKSGRSEQLSRTAAKSGLLQYYNIRGLEH